MLILALQTSSSTGSIALAGSNGSLYYEEWTRPKGRPRKGEKFLSHSEMVGMSVEKALQQNSLTLSDIDHFVTSVGPGSFTGIRVGVGAARSYGYALNKPVFGYDSLLTQAFRGRHSKLPILCMLNAYKSQVYTSAFKFSENPLPKVLWGPLSIPVTELDQRIKEPHLCIGDGYSTYLNSLSNNLITNLVLPEDPSWNEPSANDLIQLHKLSLDQRPNSSWQDVNPLYIRASEAEEKLLEGLLKPIKSL